MDLTQLINYITVVEEGTLTKASDKLHISQPALSKTIMRIEESVGAKLFDRSGKHITVNNYGQILYLWAKNSLNGYNLAVEEIHKLQEASGNSLLIGCSGYMYALPIIMSFQAEYPEINVSNFKFSRADFPDVIYREDVDCVLSCMDYQSENASSLLLYTDQIFVCLPAGHPLAERPELHLEEIKDEKLIMSSGDTLYNYAVKKMYGNIQAEPNIGSYVQTPILIRMISNGLGISIINRETVQEVELRSAGKCVCVPLVDDFCVTSAYLLWKKTSDHSRTFRTFYEHVKKTV